MIKEILKYLSVKFGSEFCLLRDTEKLDDLESLHDIDCYLPRSYIPDLIYELEKNFDVTCHLQIHKAKFSSIIIINSVGFKKFDFDHHFSWRGLTYLNNETVENNTLNVEGINCLVPQISLAQRIIKDILGAGKLPLEKVQFLTDLRQTLKSSNDNQNINDICQFINTFPLADINDNPKKVRKNLIRFLFEKNLGRPLYILNSVVQDIYYKFCKPTGKLVVLIGPDGCGKSTMSNMLCENFGRDWFTDVVQYYSRPNILPALRSIFSTRKSGGSKIIDEPDNPNRSISLIPGLIKITYYTVDFIIFRFWLFKHKINNRLVVYDRYFYDYQIQYFYQHISPKYKRFLKWFIPKPDTIIVLEANPFEIMRRKPELDATTIEYQYEKVFELYEENTVVVRTDRDISDSFANLLAGCVATWQKK